MNPTNHNVVEVVEYPGAYHAWDWLMVPTTAVDPFGNEGSYLKGQRPTPPLVELRPDVAQAFASRERVVRFFRRYLR